MLQLLLERLSEPLCPECDERDIVEPFGMCGACYVEIMTEGLTLIKRNGIYAVK